MQQKFSISPASIGAMAFFGAIMIFILVIFFVTVYSGDFELSSGPGLLAVFFFLVVLAVMGAFIYQSQRAAFVLDDRGLHIASGLYGRTISWGKIDIGGIRIVDLNTENSLQPQWRLNGAGVPGYYAGWFKLRNGEKALLFVTNRSRIVYIPTNKKYSVLLSVSEAEEFVSAVRRWM